MIKLRPSYKLIDFQKLIDVFEQFEFSHVGQTVDQIKKYLIPEFYTTSKIGVSEETVKRALEQLEQELHLAEKSKLSEKQLQDVAKESQRIIDRADALESEIEDL